jgi:hypothetical protein
MKRGRRIFAIFATGLAVFVLGSGLLIAATGVATVRVHEKKQDGARVYVPVPAILLYAGAAVLPMAVPAAERARIREHMGDRRPAVIALLAELERCPDAVLVDAQDHGESVQIVKEGGSLTVRVRDADTDVDVSLPAGVVTHVVRALTV